MEDIKSETGFLWVLIKSILLWPITLILVLFGKKKPVELFNPIIEIWKFIFEAKFTLTIIIINILVFFFLQIPLGPDFTDKYSLYPLDLLKFNFLSLFTAGFLHQSLAHLLGNMAAIFIFGRVVEKKLGFFKTAIVYFIGLIIASLFHSITYLILGNLDMGGLGASGAISGLIAAAMLLDPFYLSYELIVPLPVFLLGGLTLYANISGIINPTDTSIGYYAHLGGFLSMTLLFFFFSSEDKQKLRKGLIINLILFFLFGLIYHFMGQ